MTTQPEIKLPPLPECDSYCTYKDSHDYDVWNAENMQAFARAAVLADRAARAVEVPEGWLLVPIEPTLEMIDAWNHRFGSRTVTAQTDWTNMISAAPTQELTPAPNQGDPS